MQAYASRDATERVTANPERLLRLFDILTRHCLTVTAEGLEALNLSDHCYFSIASGFSMPHQSMSFREVPSNQAETSRYLSVLVRQIWCERMSRCWLTETRHFWHCPVGR